MEADIACDPIISLQLLKVPHISDIEKVSQTLQGRKRFTGSRALLSNVKENIESSSAEDKLKSVCILCKGKNELDVCKDFLSKPLSERKVFVCEKSLCYRCL